VVTAAGGTAADDAGNADDTSTKTSITTSSS
jgi:hypothetical protein